MVFNTKHWETVKDGEFIVNLPFFEQGRLQEVGEPFVKEGSETNLWALYESEMITDVEPAIEPLAQQEKTKKRNK